MKNAFTIIEILVSVMIISVVVLGIAKIEEKNIEMSKYIGDRANSEMANTLFLPISKENLKNDNINAYDAISKVISIKKDEIKDILKDIDRNVTLSDTLSLEQEELPIPIQIRVLMLKREYPSRYYLINIGKFTIPK